MIAAFLDRDGTINAKAPEGEYVTSPQQLELVPGSARAVRRLNEAGVPVVVVTNQRGVALGRMTEHDVAAVHRGLDELLGAEGARVDAYYVCPHDEGECGCRKPEPGLIERAAADLGLGPLSQSVVIGDSESDVEAGRRAGASTVLVSPAGPSSLEEAVAGLLSA